MKIFVFLLAGLMMSGCASNIPLAIRKVPVPNPSLAEIASQAQAPTKPSVRWGGTVLKVNNFPDYTEIEMLGKPLGRYGKPVDGDEVLGRFLAHANGFLDPAVYSEGRLLTVYGPVEGIQTRNIGEKPYNYPLVKVETSYLWPPEPEYVNSMYYGYGPYWPYGYYSPFGYYPYNRIVTGGHRHRHK